MKKVALIVLCFTLSIFSLSDIAGAMAGKPSSDTDEIQGLVRDTLDRMISAYSARNAAEFMGVVSEDFAGDKVILDRAVRNDFSSFTNINIRYTLNNVASGLSDMVSVSIAFTKSCTDIKSGFNTTKNGKTEFVFKREGDRLSLYSMSSPLVFGVSDTSVGTGNLN